MSRGGDRVWMALALVLALFLSLTIGLTLVPGLDAAADATGTPYEIDVTLTEFAIIPDELAAPSGVPVGFTVTNAGAAEHDFTIEGVAGTETLAAGDTATLDVDALEPATYPVLCTIAGHDTAGMVARLDEPTALHGHGLVLPNAMDGVPGLTQPSILPGESFTYEFPVRDAGSHRYRSQ